MQAKDHRHGDGRDDEQRKVDPPRRGPLAGDVLDALRAGILAISKGQTEAAYALGLSPGWTMNLVILPQALRVIIPPLISQYLNLIKNSSLAVAVGYMDLRGTLGGTTLNQTGREM